MPNFTVTTELFYDSVWNDISADVRVPAGVEIQWGRSDGASGPEPARLGLVIDNTGGKYSPRNPLSTLSGKIGRNTKIRVTISGDAAFTGEVSSWPTRWNIPGRNKWMPIEAAGLLRRISQGNPPVISSLLGYYSNATPVRYWSLQDGETAIQGTPNAGTATGTGQSVNFRRQSGFAVREFGKGTLAPHLPLVLRINDTNPAAGFDQMIGACRGSSATPTAVAMDFMYKVDTEIIAGTLPAYPAGRFVATLYTFNLTNSASDGLELTFRHDGSNDDLSLVLGTNDGAGGFATVTVGDSVPLDAVVDTAVHHVRVQATQNGANIDCIVYMDGVSVLTGTVTSHTLLRTDSVGFQYDRASNTTDGLVALGHVAVFENTANIPAIATTYLASLGFAGETAGRRIERLCAEQGVAFVAGGNLDDSMPMGLEYDDQFSGQLAECEATDFGLIGESRNAIEVSYTPRTALYNQTPLAVIDYDAGELSPPLEPVDDDQATRNDIFAQRREGGSYRATQTSGPLSIQDPPAGVGRYKVEVPVNVQTDDILPEVAGWLLGVGTVDAARYPQVTINRNNPAVQASVNNLGITVRAVDAGEVIRIKSGPKLRAAAGIYDDIDLLVLGCRRFCDGFNDVFTFNCIPYQPYRVVALDTADGRVDPDGALTLNSSATTTATSLSVACAAGTLASTDGADYPCSVMIAGEEVTVTAVSGASSPQTFTVTRSVNGVVKAQSAGAVLALKIPGLVAL